MEKKEINMDWMKKHVDAVVVISTIIGSMVWINGKFTQLEKDVAIMKTVLLMKGIMPPELISKQINENIQGK